AQRDSVAVWGLSSQFDRDQVRLPEGGTVEGTLVVRNLSDQPATGFGVQLVASDPGTQFELLDAGGEVLGPLEFRTVRWRVTATESSAASLLTATATTAQASTAVAYSQTLVVPNVAALVASPSPIDVEMQVGEVTYVPVRVRNDGTDATGPLTVSVADVPWLQLVTPAALPPLDPGAETVVNLRLAPAADLVLGPYSAQGAVVVRDTTDPTVGVSVNGRFEATSDALASLLVQARSESSYYFPEGSSPSYPGATVEVRRKDDNSLIASGLVDSIGEISFSKLEPGIHSVRVTAPEHGTFSTDIDLRPGANEILAFMPRQLVTVQWSVVQVPFTDEYVITVSLTFQTNVPVPVITVDCDPGQPGDQPVLDFASMTAPTKVANVKVSNRGGLIAARGFRWTFGASPRYEVMPLVENLGDIGAGQEIEVPVLMIDHGFGGAGGSSFGGSANDCIAPSLRGNWQLDCDGLRDFG
ncbi:MAG: carboxypeptidase regulatory-like domain-containing protein, partial [Actinobacteria bacterium]|nr:carboxypeptidase regulatory-like domain-containing protein [Actinomycetota bacterium]